MKSVLDRTKSTLKKVNNRITGQRTSEPADDMHQQNTQAVSANTAAVVAADSVEAWIQKGEQNLVDKDLAGTIECCNKALALDIKCNRAHTLMAEAKMPGERYIPLMSRIHQKLKPQTYIEIGVATGQSLALADRETHAVGIDPNFRISARINARARLFPITSDAFFERYEPFEELNHKQLDLAFIDGLHYFEQTLRDFINVEKFSNKNTVILIHDCFPATKVGADRERVTGYWAGDVWKVIPCLKVFRPDLQVNIVPAFPSGLAIVTLADSQSTVLDERFDEIVAKYRDADYGIFENNQDGLFDTVDNDWQKISALIPEPT